MSNEQIAERKSGERRVASDWDAAGTWLLLPCLTLLLGYLLWASSPINSGYTIAETLGVALLIMLVAFLIFACVNAFRTPVIILCVDGDEFIVREYWLGKTRTSRFRITTESFPRIVEGKDADDNRVHVVQITTPEKRTIVVAKRLTRRRAEAVISQMGLPTKQYEDSAD